MVTSGFFYGVNSDITNVSFIHEKKKYMEVLPITFAYGCIVREKFKAYRLTNGKINLPDIR